MTFAEKLRRARSHLLVVAIMLLTAILVVSLEDENLSRETGKPVPDHGRSIGLSAAD